MAIDLKLVTTATTENPDVGDLEVSDREFVLVSDLPAVAQEVEVVLRWERGEWFLDVTRGTPWFAEILGKGTPLSTIRSLLVTEILTVPDVTFVRRLDLELDPVERLLTGDGEIVAFGTAVPITVGPIAIGA